MRNLHLKSLDLEGDRVAILPAGSFVVERISIRSVKSGINSALRRDRPARGEYTCRRLRCRGRSLLVLATTLLMVGCRDPVARLHELGAEVTQDAHGGASVSCQRTKDTNAILKHLPDLGQVRSLVLNDTDVTDTGLRSLTELTGLETLTVGVGRRVTNAGLVHLVKLKNLKELALVSTRVTDEGMEQVADIGGLRQLCVSNVSDAGFQHLRKTTNLEHLELMHAEITHVGVQDLQALRRLKFLSLLWCRISDADLDDLKRGLPGCQLTVASDRAK